MPNFATSYVPPGIYTDENPVITQQGVGIAPSAVAIVGPSIGYRTFVEPVVLNGTTAAPLSKLGIDNASLVVKASDGTTYSSVDDYALTVGPGADANAGATADNTLTIARKTTGVIPSGATVYVSYHYTDTTFTDAVALTSYASVRDAFGEGYAADGTIQSPLSVAAKFAFDNGAAEVICVSTPGFGTTTRSNLASGLTKLAAMERATVVVPIAAGVSSADAGGVGTDLKAHVEASSLEGLYRIGVLGFDGTVTEAPTTTAGGFVSHRMIHVWPNRLLTFNPVLGTTQEVGGYYLAAACAALLVANGVEQPLTRKIVSGFSGIVGNVMATMTPTLKNTYSNAGITVLEKSQESRLVVRHGVTTDTSSINAREVSLVRSKDHMLAALRSTFDNSGVIGSAIDGLMPSKVKSMAQGVLETEKRAGVIVDYDSLSVRQAPSDPTVIEVGFRYRPAYPLNYVHITYSINPTTGDSNVIDALTA